MLLVTVSTFDFGSSSGSLVAFVLFLGVAAVIGVAVSTFVAQLTQRGWLRGKHNRSTGVALGVMAGILVLASLYLSTIDGFYHLSASQTGVELAYILPERKVVLPTAELSEVTRVPTYKSRWKLVLYTRTGQRFESAQASYQDVLRAWTWLHDKFPVK